MIKNKTIHKYLPKTIFAIIALFFLVVAVKKLLLLFPYIENENKYDAILSSINTAVILVGGFLSVLSFVTSNRKNYNMKILDKKADLACELLENFQNVKYAILRIANCFSSYAEETKEITDETNNNIKQALRFKNRLLKEEAIFNKWFSLVMKAKIYFDGETFKILEETRNFINDLVIEIEIALETEKSDECNRNIWKIDKENRKDDGVLAGFEKRLNKQLEKYLKEELDNV